MMRYTKRSLFLAALLMFNGCARDTSRYYTEVPDFEGKSSKKYIGICDEHGTLTNLSADYGGVEDAVYAHNQEHHVGGRDYIWAKVYYRKP